MRRAWMSSCVLFFSSVVAVGQLVFPDASEQTTAYLGGGNTRNNVVYVGSGGTDTQNGTALINAVSNISGASSTNPYPIQLDPGVYDLGSNTLNTKSWVHIRGTSQLGTTITSSGSVAVEGADSAVLSFLTIQNTSTSLTVYQLTAGDTVLQFVRVILSATTSGNSYGVFIDGTNPILQMLNCSIEYSGSSMGSAVYGARVQGTGAELEMENCFVGLEETGSASIVWGLRATTGNFLDIERSTIEANYATGTASSVYVQGQTDLDYCRLEASGDALYNSVQPDSDNYNIFISSSTF